MYSILTHSLEQMQIRFPCNTPGTQNTIPRAIGGGEIKFPAQFLKVSSTVREAMGPTGTLLRTDHSDTIFFIPLVALGDALSSSMQTSPTSPCSWDLSDKKGLTGWPPQSFSASGFSVTATQRVHIRPLFWRQRFPGSEMHIHLTIFLKCYAIHVGCRQSYFLLLFIALCTLSLHVPGHHYDRRHHGRRVWEDLEFPPVSREKRYIYLAMQVKYSVLPYWRIRVLINQNVCTDRRTVVVCPSRHVPTAVEKPNDTVGALTSEMKI